MSKVIVPSDVDTSIRKDFEPAEVKAFDSAVAKLRQATLQTRQRLLTGVKSNRFKKVDARWTMRASRKYRVLLGQDNNNDIVVRGLVSRGDHRFYPKE